MGKLKLIFIAAIAAMLGACSGGSDDSFVGGGAAPGVPGQAAVGSLTLLTSSPQISSDGGGNATISALVRDANNNVMEDISVIFSANSGGLAVSQPPTTNSSGVVTAILTTAGDRSNRTITINGIAGGSAQATVSVDVVGTSIQINGPASIPSGQTANYTAVLSDANSNGIPNSTLTVTSASGNTITLASTTTDSAGELDFTVTGAVAGADTLTASALGATGLLTFDVSSDSYTFVTPDPAGPLTEIDLGDEADIEVSWLAGAGLNVTFATSRGGFTDCAATPIAGTVAADGVGTAALCVTSNNAGPAVITATNQSGTSIQANVEFVATTPAAIELQINPATIRTNGQSQITAVVRDANGNLVKNQTVSFVLTDVTGGALSVAQAITNSQGRAQTIYSATSTTSALDGVRIDATVQGTAVTNFETLTVAQRELFISIGTGNQISEPNTAQYRKEWVVQVTDAQGNGVANSNVTFSVLSELYWHGYREFPLGATSWSTVTNPPNGCIDEDILTGNPSYDRNGVLDPGEDNNMSGEIEAGNIASAAAQSGGSTIVTDANGFGIINVYWPQEYAYYLVVTLEARVTVQGTESAESTTFTLDGLASDFTSATVAPPGLVSPFGLTGVCVEAP
jgi:hypothetical protein